MLDSYLLNGMIESVRLFEERPRTFTAVSTDTRKLENGNLFVPLVGDRFNGHDFLEAAISRGAVAALWQVDQPHPASLPADFQLYFVKNTLRALQQMAKAYREKINPIVIGITGSNGKTTTKDLLSSILSLHKQTHKTEGNYNNHIGLPLTMLAMPPSCHYLIVEMGMSDFGEIALLSELARPDWAIVTNIGDSHMEQVGSRAGIAKAKMEIKQGLKREGVVILDGDEPLLEPYMDERTCTVGFASKCDVVVSNVHATENGYTFNYQSSLAVKLPLLGKHNVKNASYCITLARKLDLPDELIAKGLHNVSLTNMRLERQVGKYGELIINDAYNASPTSMKAALETLKALPNFKKYIAVLGDIYELGKDEELLHRSIADAISEPITDLVFIGNNAQWIADEWKKKNKAHISVFQTDSREKVAAYLRTIVDAHSVVLFKASRGMKLEDIIESYQNNRKGDDE